MNKILLILVLLIFSYTAFAEERIALVIGNSAYKTLPLSNPVNDASDIAHVLSTLGFSVTKKLNADQRQMKKAISEFGKALSRPDAVGLFYFAGHGVQFKNRNYLIPVGVAIESEADVEFEGIDAGRVLGQMENAGNNLNLVILDACRDNPFGGSFRSTKRGLARIVAPKGSMILYAASPGEKAADGKGRNGIFTQNLLAQLKQPGLTVDQVFKRTAEAVYKVTSKNQLPYREGSIIGEFYFKPGERINDRASITKSPDVINQSAEDRFIQHMNQDNPGEMKLYLEKFPQGQLASLFRYKLKNSLSLKMPLQDRGLAAWNSCQSNLSPVLLSANQDSKMELRKCIFGEIKKMSESQIMSMPEFIKLNEDKVVKLTSNCTAAQLRRLGKPELSWCVTTPKPEQ